MVSRLPKSASVQTTVRDTTLNRLSAFRGARRLAESAGTPAKSGFYQPVQAARSRQGEILLTAAAKTRSGETYTVRFLGEAGDKRFFRLVPYWQGQWPYLAQKSANPNEHPDASNRFLVGMRAHRSLFSSRFDPITDEPLLWGLEYSLKDYTEPMPLNLVEGASLLVPKHEVTDSLKNLPPPPKAAPMGAYRDLIDGLLGAPSDLAHRVAVTRYLYAQVLMLAAELPRDALDWKMDDKLYPVVMRRATRPHVASGLGITATLEMKYGARMDSLPVPLNLKPYQTGYVQAFNRFATVLLAYMQGGMYALEQLKKENRPDDHREPLSPFIEAFRKINLAVEMSQAAPDAPGYVRSNLLSAAKLMADARSHAFTGPHSPNPLSPLLGRMLPAITPKQVEQDAQAWEKAPHDAMASAVHEALNAAQAARKNGVA